jgi:hypothetical protein
MSLSQDTAKKFFTSLYEEAPLGLDGHFDAAVTRLVSKQGDTAVAGDQALQSLLLNYALSTPENAVKAKSITASLAGIKQQAVSHFAETFPNADLNTLIESAKAAGYDVDVLKSS